MNAFIAYLFTANSFIDSPLIANSFSVILFTAVTIRKKSHKKLVFFLSFFYFQAREQASKQARKQERKLFGTSIPNFTQIVSEIEIVAHFSLCKQASK